VKERRVQQCSRDQSYQDNSRIGRGGDFDMAGEEDGVNLCKVGV